VKSRDYDQLKGNIKSVADLSDCDPVTTIDDLGYNKTVSGLELTSDQPANPCGLVAKRYSQFIFTLKFQ
jgi:hypothetical protein